MGNWDSYQITQLNHVVQPTDSEQALSECLLTLSKHLVNRTDSFWAARQQTAYFSTLSSTPEADPITVRALQRRCFKPRSAPLSQPLFLHAVRPGHVPEI